MRRTLKAATMMAAPALVAGLLAACDDGGSSETAGTPKVAVTSPAPSRPPSGADDRTDTFDPAVDEFLPGSRRVPVR